MPSMSPSHLKWSLSLSSDGICQTTTKCAVIIINIVCLTTNSQQHKTYQKSVYNNIYIQHIYVCLANIQYWSVNNHIVTVYIIGQIR